MKVRETLDFLEENALIIFVGGIMLASMIIKVIS